MRSVIIPGLRRLAPGALLLGAVGLLLACGPKVPQHDGYAAAKPWAKPKPLALDSTGEADLDDSVSYPKKRRARWYRLELPGSGELEARLAPVMLGRDDVPKLAIEVLDHGYNVLMTSEAGDGEADDRDKTLQLLELPKGVYYLHVYALDRLTAGDYNLRVKYRPGGVDAPSSFPDQVAFVPPLPIVPAFDDAPPPEQPKTRGRGTTKTTTTPKSNQPAATAKTVRIIGAVASGGGTKITLGAGTNDGVEAGWKGQVVTTSGTPIPGGDFTIDTVLPSRSTATVRLGRDAVIEAKRARIRP